MAQLIYFSSLWGAIMILPILERLQNGEKFDFPTLADNVEQTDQYWNWWWEEKAKGNDLSQPEIIENDDPILVETFHKETVDLSTNREFFDSHLLRNPDICSIHPCDDVSRYDFRNVLLRIAANGSVKLEGRRTIIFSGGGYGSGKTTIINHLAEAKCLAVRTSDLVSSDIFRQLIPEFNLIKAVGDGRASFTVHKECTDLTDQLFELLVDDGRSFVFDSSMGHKANALRRIEFAKSRGYFLTLIAVLTPLEVAIRFAMRRAKISRRFPIFHDYKQSHVSFIEEFRNYFPHFDEIKVLANLEENRDIELVAEKKAGESLAITNSEVFNSPQFMPIKA
jgi:predicted ABC-type ATPase